METRRYCGRCLNELAPGQQVCPGCGRELPAGSLDPGPAGAGAPASSGPPEATRAPVSSDTVGDYPTAGAPSADEGLQGWRDGQIVAERFRIHQCIGQGGMGKVFLAQDLILGRPIALKRVPQEIIFDSDARDDLRQEVNRLLDLAHENVIRVHTYYDEPAWPFFAMEYLQGPTLKDLLRQRKVGGRLFAFEEVLEIVRQVGRGLAYAHSKNLVHRDLKPGNLMLAAQPNGMISSADVIKITDFGISRVVADSTLRQTGKLSGTLPYMSPEQFRGEESTARSDIYSLAATLYELLSGKPPFHTGDIGYQIINVAPRPIPDLPPGASAVLLRALAKDPQQRFSSVEGFVDALEMRPAPAGAIGSPGLAGRLRAAFLFAGAAAVVLLFALGVKLLTGGIGNGGEAGGGGKDGSLGQGEPSTVLPPAPAIERIDIAALESAILKQLDDRIQDRINTRTLTFQIHREGELKKSAALFDSLYFILDPDQPGRREIFGSSGFDASGRLRSEIHEFPVDNLTEGFHSLRATLIPVVEKNLSLAAGLRVEKSFTVDLTGPVFQVEPVKREAFVKIDPGRLATFHEECDLRLVTPGNPGDIQEAFHRVVFNGLRGDPQRIADALLWKVSPLSQGQNTFKVFAKDALGNLSPEVDLRIDRLRLSVDEFSIDRIDGIRGNQVTVRGRLNVEGDQLPKLRFFVNRSMLPNLVLDFVEPSLENPNFRARLVLPRFSNVIEVRYEWGKEIFPFALPARISDVRVAAPLVSVQAPRATKESSVRVTGRVEPYFDGLVVTLVQKGVSQRRLRFDLGTNPLTADFQETIQLAPNQTNRLTIECSYDSQTLEPAPQPFEVYCDMQAPTLLDGMEFQQFGTFLHVFLVPSEPLSLMQIRAGESPDWQLVVQKQEGQYFHMVPLPTQKTTFTVEMTDLVGNIGYQSQVCNLFDPEAIIFRPGPAAEGGAGVAATGFRETARPAAGATGPAVPGRVLPVHACSFLKEIGLDFAPYGRRGEEMEVTEAPERAWNRFLIQKKGYRDLPDGSLERPMAIGLGFDERLLDEFAAWVTESCGHGPVYFVPTVKDWRAAFTGSKDSLDDGADIRRWFQGERTSGRFVPFPARPYGSSAALACGSRRENRTPTGLLDMEANLQEIVHGGGEDSWFVIGGHNKLRESELSDACIQERPFRLGLGDPLRSLTGFRIARRP